MPHPKSNPILIDYLPRIAVADLINQQLIKPGRQQSKLIKWSGSQQGSVGVLVNCRDNENQYMELSYQFGVSKIVERFPLVTKISNLDKGVTWYLLCPGSGSICKKLYLAKGRFRSLKYIRDMGGTYSDRIKSKLQRNSIGQDLRRLSKVERKIKLKGKGSMNFFHYFEGVPTKRFQNYTKNLMKKKELELRLKKSLPRH